MNIAQTPHKLHILVCTNARHDGTPSCGDSGEAQRVFETLKARLKEAKLPVRVSRTGCLGPCAQGPNVMCYAQDGTPGVWLQGVGEGDVPEIEAKVRSLLNTPSQGE
ncbi:MAG: ferredoxin, 2Fe-2S [Fibrobacteria bacterium]|jgi:(2Fe-2S) ferredoxin|nr:ferredoxin, 2Fe-2S [Fibrobacteria bacterium]